MNIEKSVAAILGHDVNEALTKANIHLPRRLEMAAVKCFLNEWVEGYDVEIVRNALNHLEKHGRLP